MKKTIALNSILIFPSSVGASLEFLERCKSMGEVVYGASSLHNDPNSQFYEEWSWLPLITDTRFQTALLELVVARKISRIFCPIPVAHKCIADILAASNIDCNLLPSPFDSELLRYQKFDKRARSAIAMAESMVDVKVPLSLIQVKSIFSHTDSVWGQCGELKLGALIAVTSDAPKGDVVEIGAFLGKSASALAMLAKWNQIGNVIVIDPWTAASAVQKDAPEYVQKLSQGSYWDAIAEQFKVNLMAVANVGVNYIRDSAENARKQYGTGTIQSKEFGSTVCCGSIAVLHIDGNHDYEAVALDSELWLPLVAPGGWIIFDDYSWAHGAGPKKVGDDVLKKFTTSIQTSFVCDGALFIKFNSEKTVAE